MIQIYWYSDTGTDPLVTPEFRSLGTWHGWTDETAGHFGVASPHNGIDPNAVADFLTEAGLTVLPGVNDGSSVPGKVISALAKYGVHPGALAKQVAQTMAAHSGMKPLRPNLF